MANRSKAEITLIVDELVSVLTNSVSTDYALGYVKETLAQILAWGGLNENDQSREIKFLMDAIRNHKFKKVA